MSVETGWITSEHWQDPVKEGNMQKRGGKGHMNKKWQTRYFRLKNDSLFWFKNVGSDTLRGHIPLKGCTLETDSPKTQKYENCFRLYSKKIDKSFYFQTTDYAEALLWIQAIKNASGSAASTQHAVPAITAKGTADGGHAMFQNEDDIESPTNTTGRIESLTLTANMTDRTAPTLPNSERSTLVQDYDSSDDL